MTNLGDYIGRLLAEVMMARVQADIEAVRVAEIYGSNPLLRNFPVPRIRLPKVEMNVPVIISEIEEEENDTFSRDKVDTRNLMLETEKIVTNELRKYMVNLDRRERTLFHQALKQKSDDIRYIRERAISMGTISKEISAEAVKVLSGFRSVKARMNEKQIEMVSEKIEDNIRNKLINKRKQPPRIKISPLTSKIKEIKNPENLVMIKLTLVEDAVEWTSIDENGEKRNILVPE